MSHACPECGGCELCCDCDAPYDADELGLDPEQDDERRGRMTVEDALRRKGPHYPGEIVED